MKTITSGTLLFLIALAASALHAEMIRGDGYSYFLSAPLGWVLDKSLAAQAEADLVLYPQGTTYFKADSVITLSTAFQGAGFKDLADLLHRDEVEGKRANPRFESRKGPMLYTKELKSAPVQFYTGLKNGACEAVAYVEDGDRIMIFALSCPNLPILHEDLPALKETVASYESIAGPERP